MTTLEMFETVETHLLNQDCRSVDGQHGMCMYRGANGRKCAVGCLIRDEFYDKEILETKGLDNGSVQAAIVKSIGRDLTNIEFKMLHKLQTIHDCMGVSNWKCELSNLKKGIISDCKSNHD